MARAVERLTALKVSRLSTPGLYADGAGLYLQVTGKGAKSWIYRFTLNAKTRDMGLGSAITIGLADARGAAAAARKLLHAGIDPIEHRDRERAAAHLETVKGVTLQECAAEYIKAHGVGWRNAKHKQQWENTIATYAAPILGSLAVGSIDTGLILKVLEPIWIAKTETATRLRGRLESILDWAKARGYRTGENPARWRGHLDKLLPNPSKLQKSEHCAALPYQDMHNFMVALQRQEGSAAKALAYLILTAARTGEVIGAAKSEINAERAMWIVPAGRMKAGREHRVPLSMAALAIAKKAADDEVEFLFPGRRSRQPMSNMAMAMLLRRMGYDGITVHGFRSAFRDWCAEQTNYPREIAEAALAHINSDETESAYLRTDFLERRRRLMEEWSRFCMAPRSSSLKLVEHRRRRG